MRNLRHLRVGSQILSERDGQLQIAGECGDLRHLAIRCGLLIAQTCGDQLAPVERLLDANDCRTCPVDGLSLFALNSNISLYISADLSFAIIPSCALDLRGTGFLGLHPDGSPLLFD